MKQSALSTILLIFIFIFAVINSAYADEPLSDNIYADTGRDSHCVFLKPGEGVITELSLGGEALSLDCLESFNKILVSSGLHELKFCVHIGESTVPGREHASYRPEIIMQDHHKYHYYNKTTAMRYQTEEAGVYPSSGAIDAVQVEASASTYSVVIDSLLDSPANSSACSGTVLSGNCNFRSAVAFCTSTWNTISTDECIIEFPGGETISVDPFLGDINVSDVGGTLVLEGNGCVVEMLSVSQQYSRLLSMEVTGGDPIPELHFKVQNLAVRNFGILNNSFGGAIYLSGLSSVTIKGVTFTRNRAYRGGSIFLDGCGNVRIAECIFADISASSSGGAIELMSDNLDAIVTDCSFTNITSFVGGAISLDTGNNGVKIHDCNFTYLNASFGGAISMNSDNWQVEISGCMFTDTFADQFGGAIRLNSNNYRMEVSACTFTGNYGFNGGAIYLSSSNLYSAISNCSFQETFSSYAGGAIRADSYNIGLEIINCRFSDVSSTYGGAIALYSGNNNFTLSGSTFTDSFAGCCGGAMYLESVNSYGTIFDSQFTNTSAGFGGALYLFNGNNGMEIRDCGFAESYASAGGVLDVNYGNLGTTILNCTFRDSSAVQDGGAIRLYSDNTYLVIQNCTFMDIFSGNQGGAIHASFQNSFMKLIYTTFIRCSAENGGGLYGANSNDHISFTYVSFHHNNASESGGAIFLRDSNTYATLSYVYFESNSAGSEGGALGALSSNTGMKIIDCIFISNSAGFAGGAVHSALMNSDFSVENSIFKDSSSPYGGSMYFGNDHDGIFLTNNSYRTSSSDYGGGMYIAPFNTGISLVFCVWERNAAKMQGGAIYIHAADLQMHECRVMNNYAGGSGAGVYAIVEQVTISSCDFHGNIAKGSNGGLVMEFAASAIIASTNFTNSRASSGGAMTCSSCDWVEVQGCYFDSNTATTDFGGALLLKDSPGHIMDTEFTTNSAELSGGAFYFDGGNLKVERCVFIGNAVFQGFGGSMWVSGSLNSTIYDNHFVDNHAPRGGGGALFWTVTSGMTEPHGIPNNTWSLSNTALYGNDVATDEFDLVLDSLNNYIVTDYTLSYVPPLVVYVVDYYGQVVRTESSAVVTTAVLSAAHCYDGSDGYVTAGFVLQVFEGMSNFTALSIYCDPGYSLPINMTCTTENTLLSTYFVMSFRSCETGEYYGDSICTMCEDGTYSLTDPSTTSLSDLSQSTVCKECPRGSSKCFGDVIEVQKGYWRIAESATTLLSCPYGEFGCKGGSGSGDDLCRAGYTGPLCAVCDDGYAYQSASLKCEVCGTNSGFDVITILAILVVIALGAIAGYLYWHPDSSRRVKSMNDFYVLVFAKLGLIRIEKENAKKEAKSIARRLRSRLRIYTTLWQIISIMPFVLDMQFPDSYSAIASVLRIFNLDITRSALVSCSSGASYDAIGRLLTSTIYPVVFVFFIFLMQSIHVWFRERLSMQHRALDSSHIKSNYFAAFLVFTYLILPSTTVTIFQVFSCEDVDPDDAADGEDRFMMADYSVSCSSSEYYFGFFWAVGSVVVYPIGIPAYYLYLLFSERTDIMCRDDVSCCEEEVDIRSRRLRPLRLLFEAYEPRLWYWAFVETARRLSLTGVLVVIAQGSAIQIVVGLSLSLFFLKLYDFSKPYSDDTVQSVEMIAQWQVYFVFFLALLLKADFGSFGTVMVEFFLIVVLFANILHDLGKLAMTYINAKTLTDHNGGVQSQKEMMQDDRHIDDCPEDDIGFEDFECGPGRLTEMIEITAGGGISADIRVTNDKADTWNDTVICCPTEDNYEGIKEDGACENTLKGISSSGNNGCSEAISLSVSSPLHDE